MEWHLQPGETILRRHLHDRYGGNRQGGISPSRKSPNIFIFTDPEVGEVYGYRDQWEEGILHYAGHGQRGDQGMARGNLAILRHLDDGRDLRVFEGVRGEVTYLGEFELDSDPTYIVEAPQLEGGRRKVIMFRLRPIR